MADYPDSDEEFEAMYADELDLLREHDEGEPLPPNSRNINTPAKPHINIVQNVVIPPKQTPIRNNFVPTTESNDFEPFDENIDFEQVDEFTQNTGTKRTIDSLFGNIDDITEEEISLPKPKKLKKHNEKNYDKEFAFIQHIIELRRLANQKDDPGAAFGKNYVQFRVDQLMNNLSFVEPKYSNIGVTRHDKAKVYVRCHSESFMKELKAQMVTDMSFKGVMGGRFKAVWDEAQNILNDSSFSESEIQISQARPDNESSLWVDLYKPRKYIELLSDEGTNRILLKWLKLWDKAVFNRRPKIRVVAPAPSGKPNYFQKKELETELDEHGRPQHKIALLGGPPGLGKTTLAHMVAKHAGYKVVEINASDDRSTEKFKTALENATQMSSVLDSEKRPNCLIFDEIDGAPAASIDFLIKFVNGAHVPKSAKGKKQTATLLKRPIICICNDAYVPALRSLKQIAFVVHFPPTASNRLAERLKEICNKEGIKTNIVALMALAEKSNNDIRSCLSILHFFKSQNKPVLLTDIMKTSLGQKDVQKGLFTVWNDIFQIERPKKKDETATLTSRWNKIQSVISSFGDYERVAQGVFENFPNMNVKDSSMVGTCHALDWFSFTDIVSTKINTLQNYSLSQYLQYGFIVWHYVFASYQYPKITYPSIGGEMRAKTTKNKAILTEVLKGMKPSIRVYTNQSSIKLDVLPLLIEIITPPLRPVNLHLYTSNEKEQLTKIVHIMIDYNLNYIQERNQEGSYVFNLDPPIEDVVIFSTSKTKRVLTYSNRQLIAREIEIEKMRRLEHTKHGETAAAKPRKVPVPMQKQKSPNQLPNHLQKLKAKAINVNKTTRSGLGGFLLQKEVQNEVVVDDNDPVNAPVSRDIWYDYKEGYTNAVRKHVKVSAWL